MNAWVVFALARRSIATGSLRGYWAGVAADAGEPGTAGRGVTAGLAAVVWLALLPVVPALTAVRRRVFGVALQAMVRDVVAGGQVSRAIDRGARMLARTGMDGAEARATAERLLAGFLSASQVRAGAAAPGGEQAAPGGRRG